MVTKKKNDEMNLDGVSFEAALKELEEMVNKLENGEMELEDCLKGFERSTKLLHFCENKLNETEKKLEILRKTSNDKAEFQKFDRQG